MKKYIVWFLLCLIWGSTWFFIKLGLRDLPPMSFAGLRFALAGLILVIALLMRREPMIRNRSDWFLISITGVMVFTCNYGLVFWGGQFVPSGLASVLQATVPIFGIFIAHFYLPGEQITGKKVLCALLALSGVVVIFADQLRVQGSWAMFGSAAIVIGAFSGAYANVLVKQRGERIKPSFLACAQMIVGMTPLLIAAALFDGNPIHLKWTQQASLSILYLAIVGSVLTFILYYWLIRQMDVTKVMLMGLVTPLITAVLGMLKLNERPTWRACLGGLAILVGTGALLKVREPVGYRKDTSEMDLETLSVR